MLIDQRLINLHLSCNYVKFCQREFNVEDVESVKGLNGRGGEYLTTVITMSSRDV